MLVTKVIVRLCEDEWLPHSCAECPFVTTNVNAHYDEIAKVFLDNEFFCGIMDRPEKPWIVTEYVENEGGYPVGRHLGCPLFPEMPEGYDENF